MNDDSNERSGDEDSGKTINASACPHCGGVVDVDGGEIACLACGLVLNEYARTGALSVFRRVKEHVSEEAI